MHLPVLAFKVFNASSRLRSFDLSMKTYTENRNPETVSEASIPAWKHRRKQNGL